MIPTETESGFPPIVLTFAASDPSGGAGMQADLLTLASMGCHPLSVITALTVQDTAGEVLNLGMRLAGRFQYDFTSFSKLAADAGFATVRVAYNESRFEALRGLDLRRTDEAVSMYLECTPSV